MAKAILRFFASWNPQSAEENAALAPEWEEILKGGNLVFCMDGVYAQDVPEIAQAWDKAYAPVFLFEKLCAFAVSPRVGRVD